MEGCRCRVTKATVDETFNIPSGRKDNRPCSCYRKVKSLSIGQESRKPILNGRIGNWCLSLSLFLSR